MNELPIVVNKHWQDFQVYIGRGSKWGNPYSHKEGTKALFKVDTVEQAIAGYRDHLWGQIREGSISIDDLKSLAGKSLGCTCKPRPCHGDIIVKAVEWALRY
ncbi:hypothetical protein vBPpSSYP_163 [Pseudomonas phage vB_PpS_SYP]|nr:hypothetical protein vBPpSSYP_163 [Pseudomonas phage vB_PpS_SYP]